MLRRVISGGQTGVDRAGLEAARAVGIETGGSVPRGWKTEAGTDLSLRDFGVEPHTSSNYPARTQHNVLNSDGTLIIGRFPLDGGSLYTQSLAWRAKKPWFAVFKLDEYNLQQAFEWIERKQISTLNVAGNRESKNPGLQREAQAWLEKLFQAAKEQQADGN